jgi:hypothetical protein
VFSDWAVAFNMFFNTAHPVGASFNNARTIESVLANGLEAIPGGSGIMAILAARNLRRGLALRFPGGQGAAHALGLTPLTAAEPTARLRPSAAHLRPARPPCRCLRPDIAVGDDLLAVVAGRHGEHQSRRGAHGLLREAGTSRSCSTRARRESRASAATTIWRTLTLAVGGIS